MLIEVTDYRQINVEENFKRKLGYTGLQKQVAQTYESC